MIKKFRGITNANVTCSISIFEEAVSVTNNATELTKMFAGYSQLLELYDEFENSFSENTTFADAKNHFTPNIQQTIISK